VNRPALLAAVQVAAVAAILACLMTLAALHPWRLDLTPERRFTLSPYTREILAKLDRDVRITAFYSSQGVAIRHEMEDLLALYRDAQPRIEVRLLDLDRNPGAAKRLGVTSYNTAVLEAGERRQPVGLVAEEPITAALLAVAGTPPVVTYFVVGHGEHDPRDTDERRGASDAARALGAEGFDVRVLAGAAHIPADAGLVVLGGPTRDVTPAEADALARHLAGGGRLLVLVDPGAPATLAALLARFGVEAAGDVVVDEQGRLLGTDGLSARVAYLNQLLVPDALEVQALLPVAQSMRLVDVPGVRADYLAMTSETTWADVDRRPSDQGAAAFRPGRDRRGPLPVAAFVRVPAETGAEGRLVVIGDADFATNLYAGVLGNRDLLLTAAGLAVRPQVVGAARPPAPPGGAFSPLVLTAGEARAIFWGAVMAPAALLLATALALARRRRSA
jgi:ABC-type uncharacterized transport system involved in gliding motility auxiliary subunit